MYILKIDKVVEGFKYSNYITTLYILLNVIYTIHRPPA